MRSILTLVLVATISAAAAAADNFPQWRGLASDGVAPDESGLAAAASWGKDAPKPIWENTDVTGDNADGFSCVAVAGGKAVVYVNKGYRVPFEERKLSQEGLRNLGAFGLKLPDELAIAVEAVRVSDERKKIPGKEFDAWLKKWLEDNIKDEADRKKFGGMAADRIRRADKAWALELLYKLDTIKDRQFANQAELDKWYADNGITPEQQKSINGQIATYHQKAWDQVWAMNLADGTTAWKAQWEAAFSGWGCSSTPCIAGDKVYGAGSAGEVYCLTLDKGAEVWRKKAGGGLLHSSVMVLGDKVIVAAGNLKALKAADGEQIWESKLVRANQNSPVAWKSGEKTYIVCNTGEKCSAVDPEDGKVLWSVDGGGMSTAAVEGDLLAIYSAKKEVGLVVYKMMPEKAEKLWSKPEVVDGAASPIVHGGYVYAVGAGRALCANAENGTVRWEDKIGGDGHTSPVLADKKVFALVGRNLMVWNAETDKAERLANVKLPAAAYVSPVIAGGKLYVRLQKATACYDLTKPVEKPAEVKKEEPKK